MDRNNAIPNLRNFVFVNTNQTVKENEMVSTNLHSIDPVVWENNVGIYNKNHNVSIQFQHHRDTEWLVIKIFLTSRDTLVPKPK